MNSSGVLPRLLEPLPVQIAMPFIDFTGQNMMNITFPLGESHTAQEERQSSRKQNCFCLNVPLEIL
jgi:hypothetical protein